MGNFLLAENGLSGHSVRGAVDYAKPGRTQDLEQTVRHAADVVYQALDLTGQSLGKAVETVSDKAFQSAGDVGAAIGSQQAMGGGSFSWGGYIQALGILSLLLAGLWFAVWLIRRYGKFNFLPRPGNLPRDALVMEMQLPLGPKKGLMVVRFLNRRLLLGVTEHQISLLTEDMARDERQGHGKDFQDIMEDARIAGPDSGAGGASA